MAESDHLEMGTWADVKHGRQSKTRRRASSAEWLSEWRTPQGLARRIAHFPARDCTVGDGAMEWTELW